ncbi:MAG: hypothetical protein AAFN77_20795 [Planctomycetota bacterium]
MTRLCPVCNIGHLVKRECNNRACSSFGKRFSKIGILTFELFEALDVLVDRWSDEVVENDFYAESVSLAIGKMIDEDRLRVALDDEFGADGKNRLRKAVWGRDLEACKNWRCRIRNMRLVLCFHEDEEPDKVADKSKNNRKFKACLEHPEEEVREAAVVLNKRGKHSRISTIMNLRSCNKSDAKTFLDRMDKYEIRNNTPDN